MSTNTVKQAIGQATSQLSIDNQRPEALTPSVFVENFGKFERVGATFTHKISRPLRTQLVGHSKPVGQPEPADKQALLKKIVRRLASSSKNYLAVGNSIDFYQNRSNFDRDTIHLFTLYADRWEPSPQILHWGWLIQFLNHFYTPTVESYVQDLSGAPAPTITPTRPAPLPEPSRNQSNNLTMNRRFRNTQELREYTEKLIQDGVPAGAVGDYMVKMLEKHNW